MTPVRVVSDSAETISATSRINSSAGPRVEVSDFFDPLAGRIGGIVPSAATRGGIGPRVLLFPGALMHNETQSLTTCTLEVAGWSRRERRALGRRIERLARSRARIPR